MSTPEERLLATGCRLPPAPEPFGAYRPTVDVQTQSDGSILCYVSGHGPQLPDKSFMHGKVGVDMTKEEAVRASKQTALSVLATLRNRHGTLNAVKRILKSLVMVNCVPSFTDHIAVANGYSEFMKEIFGDSGVGVRSAVGMGSLPMHTPVEVELQVEFFPPKGRGYPLYDSVVNCCGHFTSLGGSLIHPKAMEAMIRVSKHFVDLNELIVNAGERIKDLCNAPPGYNGHVTCGAAAGLSLSAIACIAKGMGHDGFDPAVISSLPKIPPTCSRRVILVDAGSDMRWLQSIELSGAKVVAVGAGGRKPMTEADLQAALSKYAETIAGLYYFSGGGENILSIGDVVDVVRRNHALDIPIIVDAAARLPPVSNLTLFVETYGVDCVLFSGGKIVKGPQSSGFMIGKDWLIRAARASACPNESTVGRPMKTSKESVVGLVAALEEFVKDNKAYPHEANCFARFIAGGLLAGPGGLQHYFDAVLRNGEDAGMSDVQPNMHELVHIKLKNLKLENECTGVSTSSTSLYGEGVNHGNPMKIMVTSPATYLADRLSNCSPRRIAVNTTESGLLINPIVMTEDDASYVVGKIFSEVEGMARRFGSGTYKEAANALASAKL